MFNTNKFPLLFGFPLLISIIAGTLYLTDALISFVILMIYSILELICGFLSIYGSEKINSKIKSK